MQGTYKISNENPVWYPHMKLTDSSIKARSKPAEKQFKLFDGEGLFLLVKPNGRRYWRLSYRQAGKSKTFALGVYPQITLKEARIAKDGARKLIAQGIDPVAQRRSDEAAEQAQAITLKHAACEWLELKRPEWVPDHHSKVVSRIENHVLPYLGNRLLGDIEAHEVLTCLERVLAKGHVETAHRVRSLCSQIFRYGVVKRWVKSDPCRDLEGALPSYKRKTNHFAAVETPKEFGRLLRGIDGYPGSAPVIAALKLAPLLFVRPGELRRMEWAHVDLKAAQWRFKVIKVDRELIVPLARQAVEILQDLNMVTGRGRFVFPSLRTPNGDRCMSEAAILNALKALGYSGDQQTGHGFRAIARTMLDEHLGIRVDYIEAQLSHNVRDVNGRAYNRTTFLPERMAMMQSWADYCDRLRDGADVLELGAARL